MKKKIFISILVMLSTMALNKQTANAITPAPAVCDSSKGVCLNSPLGPNGNNPQLIIGTVINGIMGIVGSLALLMFVYGGLTWMTAAGGSDKIQKGKDIIMWATIGLIVIFASYGLVRFVFTVLGA